jgi:predicted HD superfamily hydrolase involved in NAD metabolism
MMTLEEMKKLLEASLPHKRFQHSLYVYETALKMGERFQGNMEKISIAALLHDCGREIPTKDSLQYAREHHIPLDFVEEHQPVLLHAKLGAVFAKNKYGVTDEEILHAIAEHTTGAPNMTQTSMIVYLADLLEPTRDFKGIDELRQVAKEDLEMAMLRALEHTMKYLLTYDLLIHPSCLEIYNQLAAKFKAAKDLKLGKQAK